jgi:hypothetical protein
LNSDGRLEAFVRGSDLAVWHMWQTVAGGNWSGWSSLGGVVSEEPTGATDADGRLEVFDRGGDNALWHFAQVAPGVW